VAGVVLDAAVRMTELRRMWFWGVVLTLGMAGVAGSLICFIKRLFDPAGTLFSAGNVRELLWASVSYALFGLLAGIAGAGCGHLFQGHRKGGKGGTGRTQ